jgi:CBS domain-containing protein
MGRRVADLMRPDVVKASPATDVRRAAGLMRRHGVGCLPVVDRGRLVGIVTVSDLLALLERMLAH